MTTQPVVDEDVACAIPVARLPIAELPADAAERAAATGMTTFFGQFGHAPGLIEGWLAWYQPMMLTGAVPTRTKELCRLAIARRTGCEMCQGGRFPDPTGAGPAVPPADADAVLGDRWGTFSAAEQAALGYTVAFWDDHRTVTDEVVGRATDALGYDGFLELALMVAQFSGMGRLFHVLGMPNAAPVTA
jgi:alkylhydroperoxidase family enzyme